MSRSRETISSSASISTIDERADAIWFLGGPFLGLAALAAMQASPLAVVYVWFAWIALLNGPHIFAMHTRTSLDPAERRARHPLFVRSLWILLIGPAALSLQTLLGSLGVAWARWPFIAYLVGIAVWSFWHVIRQHYGVARMHQRTSAELDRADGRIESTVLTLGLGLPFLGFIATHRDAAAEMPFLVGMSQDFAAMLGGLLALAAALGFAARQAWLFWSRGQRLIGGKLLFVVWTLGYYTLVFQSQVVRSAPLFAVVPLLVIPHDLQYHAVVWRYNRQRMIEARARQAPIGLGLRLSARLLVYAVCALAAGLAMAALSCGVDRDLGCPQRLYDLVLPGGILLRDLLVVAFYSVLAHHYFLDGQIWKRPRSARETSGNLRLRTA